ncbi:MAG: hypothetical protein P8Y70_06585 [Candidatus Lokiarchaeota archaeon]
MNFHEIDSGNMDLFFSFFSAVKTLVSELVLDDSKELKNIALSDYTIFITNLSDLEIDLILIADKTDAKAIDKLIPKIIKIIDNYRNLIIEWNGNKEDLKGLNDPLLQLIESNKKLFDKGSFTDKAEGLFKAIWAHKAKLTEEETLEIEDERNDLIKEFNITQNLKFKIDKAKQIMNLSEKLRDEESFFSYQEKIKDLRKQIKDAKFKLGHFLKKTKEAISEAVKTLGAKPLNMGDYKDGYLNLYSFSMKLKLVTKTDNWKYYKKMASMLIDKEKKKQKNFSETISKIVNLSDDINSYIE